MKRQPEPKPEAKLELTGESLTGESLMSDLLNREFKPEIAKPASEPIGDFAALLNGDFKPAVAPVVPAPIEMEEIDVMVWVEKIITIDRCAICGKIRCSCRRRETLTKTIRYQQKQKQMRPKQ